VIKSQVPILQLQRNFVMCWKKLCID
jgi:hypothetical protein